MEFMLGCGVALRLLGVGLVWEGSVLKILVGFLL